MARTYHPTTALGCIIFFAKCTKGQAFSPEEVVDYGRQIGVVFPDARAWGPYFIQAERQGWIRRSRQLFARTTSNRSVRPGWQAV